MRSNFMLQDFGHLYIYMGPSSLELSFTLDHQPIEPLHTLLFICAMAEPAAATIYAKQPIHQRGGYPLWDPDPQDEPAVEIADIEYAKNSAFVRLFNASKQPHDEYNNLAVPEKYYPLFVGKVQKRISFPANVSIQSESMVQVGSRNDVKRVRAAQCHLFTSLFTPLEIRALTQPGFSFMCCKEQVAVLLLSEVEPGRSQLDCRAGRHRAGWCIHVMGVEARFCCCHTFKA